MADRTTAGRICAMIRFDNSMLLSFGLPRSLPRADSLMPDMTPCPADAGDRCEDSPYEPQTELAYPRLRCLAGPGIERHTDSISSPMLWIGSRAV